MAVVAGNEGGAVVLLIGFVCFLRTMELLGIRAGDLRVDLAALVLVVALA